MGVWTLDDFRAELSAFCGDRGMGNERLDRVLNAAYYEITGAIEFEGLKTVQKFSTSAGIFEYRLPLRFLAYVSLTDYTNKVRLRKMEQQDTHMQEIDEDTRGLPHWWARRNDKLLIFPVPDDTYEIRGIYMMEPLPLVERTDLTVLPAQWDFSLLLLAEHYMAMQFGDTDKANQLLQRAMANLRSRKSDEELMAKTPMAGLQVAWTEEDLMEPTA